ncbi:MAG: DUF1573 domain-containing protein [Bacteroidota bacterium]|nr:DUF1573 domain-containing protein [Bacteroidota bacterium]
MKKGLFFLLIIAFISAFNGFSQQRKPAISFKQEKFDFGQIKESNGTVNHVFEFTNTGSSPILITNVVASCGCTTPEWSKQPIVPGAKGFVKAIYNPTGRPGAFDKTITVSSNADRPTVVLRITGTVVAKPVVVEPTYSEVMGDIKMKRRYISFDNIYPGTPKTETIDIINTGKTTASIAFQNLPAYLKIAVKPNILKANQKGVLEVTYDASKKGDWGFVSDYLKLSINGKQDATYTISLSATIKEDFSKLSPAQLASAPKIIFEKATYDFGTIKKGKKVEYEFNFTNQGKTDLILRKITSTCGCTTINPKEMTIKPGASSSLKVVFDSNGKEGAQNKGITIYSNDPKNSETSLLVKGMVE